MAPPVPFVMSDPIAKVIVTGEKDWSDYDAIERELKALMGLHGRSILVLCNGHIGAEALAVKAAHALGLGSHVYAPDYETHGRPALARAHQVMIDNNPGIAKLLAFEESTGRSTKDLIRRCTRAGIPWQVIRKEIVIRG